MTFDGPARHNPCPICRNLYALAAPLRAAGMIQGTAHCAGCGRWMDLGGPPDMGDWPPTAECRTCAGTGTVPEHHATGEPGGYLEYVGCPDCEPGRRTGTAAGEGDGEGWRAEDVPF